MLEEQYKSPWRMVAISPTAPEPTIGSLYAAAGGKPVVTLGFALGTGERPAGVTLGGIASYCATPWGACAIAAVRIELRGTRLMATVAKSAVGGLRAGSGDVLPVSRVNAERAIPLLDVARVLTYGNTAPWWPAGEAYAKAGTWMRRRSWADTARRMRIEAGGGTTPAVAVTLYSTLTDPVPVRASDFGEAEFLADDWEAYAVGDPPAIDVTDFRIGAMSSRAEGFYFAVDAVGGGGSGGGSGGGGGGGGDGTSPPVIPPDSSGLKCDTTLSLSARLAIQSQLNRIAMASVKWPNNPVMVQLITGSALSMIIALSGRPECAEYWTGIAADLVPPDGGGGSGGGQGQGFVYRKNGEEILVPGEDIYGVLWQP